MRFLSYGHTASLLAAWPYSRVHLSRKRSSNRRTTGGKVVLMLHRDWAWEAASRKNNRKEHCRCNRGCGEIGHEATRRRHHFGRTRLFYGCSYRFHLSGDNSRDRTFSAFLGLRSSNLTTTAFNGHLGPPRTDSGMCGGEGGRGSNTALWDRFGELQG